MQRRGVKPRRQESCNRQLAEEILIRLREPAPVVVGEGLNDAARCGIDNCEGHVDAMFSFCAFA